MNFGLDVAMSCELLYLSGLLFRGPMSCLRHREVHRAVHKSSVMHTMDFVLIYHRLQVTVHCSLLVDLAEVPAVPTCPVCSVHWISLQANVVPLQSKPPFLAAKHNGVICPRLGNIYPRSPCSITCGWYCVFLCCIHCATAMIRHLISVVLIWRGIGFCTQAGCKPPVNNIISSHQNHWPTLFRGIVFLLLNAFEV